MAFEDYHTDYNALYDEAFRQLVRRFLAEHHPPDLRHPAKRLHWEQAKPWYLLLSRAGWLAPAWPREHGGMGLTAAKHLIYLDEFETFGAARTPDHGIILLGPLLINFGSDEQKLQFLPRILSGDDIWCQGYSEPGAGSDLASLRTEAVLDGDEWVVNGQKMWTTLAGDADWIFCLVRTDKSGKKQDGISFLLIPMNTPGITVKPIRLISGYSPFCETFLENVRVPQRNVLGRVNGGWTIAKKLLGHERTMIGGMGRQLGGSTAMPAELAKQYLGEVNGRLADPILRDRVTQVTMDQRCLDWTFARTRDNAALGHQPGPESSIFKYYGTELNMRRNELMISILGPQALGWEGEGFTREETATTRAWLRSRGNSIEGGTSEVQLNIIAKRVLGLPD